MQFSSCWMADAGTTTFNAKSGQYLAKIDYYVHTEELISITNSNSPF
jgi:hypothetical protein